MSNFRGWATSVITAALLTAFFPWALGEVATFSPPVGEQSPPVSEQSPPQDMVRWVGAFGVASPNGDGCSDSASIYVDFYWADTLKDEYWSITIRDSSGSAKFFTESVETVPQHFFSWPNGTSDLADGAYQVTAYARAKDADLGFIEDYETATVIVDLTPPRIVSKLPAESRVGASVDGGTTSLDVEATYSVTTDPEVKVVFSENVGNFYYWPGYPGSNIQVYAEGGVEADGYSYYDFSTNTLTYRAFTPGLLGTYRALVNARDVACNHVSDEWQFIAAAPSSPY